MNTLLIGRKEEQEILKKALLSREAEMIAVIGRRRVGKTFLIRSTYSNELAFEITGVQNGPATEQLQIFTQQLNSTAKNTIPIPTPKNWLEAFYLLTLYLTQQQTDQKQVVFFDELPWLAAQKSGFIRALGYFWNSWAVKQNIVVVICGSAASWMIDKIINNKGGLYNRVTKRIYLQPFTLAETERYLQSRHIHFDRYQIVQLYMALGGIPHHLKEIEANKSAIQNINAICFSPNGSLRDEFLRLYPSLFTNADTHIHVIRTLASKKLGLTRKQLVELGKLSNGGGLTKTLDELSQSGFISTYRPFGKKKKEKLYRLTDEYSLFYLQFIENNVYEGDNTWHLLSQTQAYKTWSGYAFENICLKHVLNIKKALGISGVFALSSSFYKKGTATEKGTQIDLLIDRNDHVINLFEIKFYKEQYMITKAYAETLRQKMSIFRAASKTKKQLFWVVLTTFGLTPNQHSLSLGVLSLGIDDLF